jgi:hypothetical protein
LDIRGKDFAVAQLLGRLLSILLTAQNTGTPKL